MKKIMLLCTLIFSLVFLQGCFYKEYTIKGDLHLLKVGNGEYDFTLPIVNGKARAKSGLALTFPLDEDKLDKTKEFLHLEYKMGSNDYKIYDKGSTVIVRGDIELKAIYRDYQYFSFSYEDNTYNEILVPNVKNLNPNNQAPLTKIENGQLLIRAKDTSVTFTANMQHPLMHDNKIAKVYFNGSIYLLGDEIKNITTNFHATILLVPREGKITFTEESIATLGALNITYKEQNYYPNDDLILNCANLKKDLKRGYILVALTINNQKYLLNETITYHILTTDQSLDIIPVYEKLSPLNITYQTTDFTLKLVVDNTLATVSEFYVGDKIRIIVKRQIDVYEKLVAIMLNDENILTPDFEYYNYVASTDFTLTLSIKPLRAIALNYQDDAFQIIVNDTPYTEKTIYPYQRLIIKFTKPLVPEMVLEKIFVNGQALMMQNKTVIYQVTESDTSVNITYQVGESVNYYRLNVLTNEEQILINGQAPKTHYHKTNEKKLIMTLKDKNFVLTAITINGTLITLSEQASYTINYANDNIVINNFTTLQKKTNVTFSFPEQISADGISSGQAYDITIGQEIKFNFKNNGNEYFYFKAIYLNNVRYEISEAKFEYSVIITSDTKYLQIKAEDMEVLYRVEVKVNNDIPFAIEKLTLQKNKKALLDYWQQGALINQPFFISHQHIMVKILINEYFFKESKASSIQYEINSSKVINISKDVFMKVEEQAFALTTKTRIKLGVAGGSYHGLGLLDEQINDIQQIHFSNTEIIKAYQGGTGYSNYVIGFTGISDNLEIVIITSDIYYIFGLQVKYEAATIELPTRAVNFLVTSNHLKVGNKNIFYPFAKINAHIFNPTTGALTIRSFTDLKDINNHFKASFTLTENSTNQVISADKYNVINTGIDLVYVVAAEINITYQIDNQSGNLVIILVDNGYNAHSQEELTSLYRDGSKEIILLQRNLELVVRDEMVRDSEGHELFHGVYKAIVNGQEYTLDKSHEQMLAINQHYFARSTAYKLTMEGNNFCVNASNTPHFGFDKPGDYMPDVIADVTNSIFHLFLDNNNPAQHVKQTFNNLKLIGNTNLPDVGGNDKIESKLPAWASSGIHGFIFLNGSDITLNNVLIDNCVFGAYTRGGTFNVTKTQIDNSWASSLFYSNSRLVAHQNGQLIDTRDAVTKDNLYLKPTIDQLILDQAVLKASGGPAILFVDWIHFKRGDFILNTGGQSNDDISESMRYAMMPQMGTASNINTSYSFDPTLILNDTIISNYVSGESSYYKASGIPATSIIAGLKGPFQQLSAPLPNGQKISPIDSQNRINFVSLLQNQAIYEEIAPDCNLINLTDAQRHDVRYCQNNILTGRTFKDANWRKHPVINNFITSKGAFFQGAGYDSSKYFSQAIAGGFIGGPNTENVIGAGLLYSMTGVAADPALVPLLKLGEDPVSDFSKNYFELFPSTPAGLSSFNASALLGIVHY